MRRRLRVFHHRRRRRRRRRRRHPLLWVRGGRAASTLALPTTDDVTLAPAAVEAEHTGAATSHTATAGAACPLRVAGMGERLLRPLVALCPLSAGGGPRLTAAAAAAAAAAAESGDPRLVAGGAEAIRRVTRQAVVAAVAVAAAANDQSACEREKVLAKIPGKHFGSSLCNGKIYTAP